MTWSTWEQNGQCGMLSPYASNFKFVAVLHPQTCFNPCCGSRISLPKLQTDKRGSPHLQWREENLSSPSRAASNAAQGNAQRSCTETSDPRLTHMEHMSPGAFHFSTAKNTFASAAEPPRPSGITVGCTSTRASPSCGPPPPRWIYKLIRVSRALSLMLTLASGNLCPENRATYDITAYIGDAHTRDIEKLGFSNR